MYLSVNMHARGALHGSFVPSAVSDITPQFTSTKTNAFTIKDSGFANYLNINEMRVTDCQGWCEIMVVTRPTAKNAIQIKIPTHQDPNSGEP